MKYSPIPINLQVSDWKSDENDLEEESCSQDISLDEWPEDICDDNDLRFLINDGKWTDEGDSHSFETGMSPAFITTS